MRTQAKIEKVLNFAGVELAEELTKNNFGVSNTGTGTGMFSVNYENESNTRIDLLQSVVRKHSPNAVAYIYKNI